MLISGIRTCWERLWCLFRGIFRLLPCRSILFGGGFLLWRRRWFQGLGGQSWGRLRRFSLLWNGLFFVLFRPVMRGCTSWRCRLGRCWYLLDRWFLWFTFRLALPRECRMFEGLKRFRLLLCHYILRLRSLIGFFCMLWRISCLLRLKMY